MIFYNLTKGQYEPFLYRVDYTVHQESTYKYANDQRYWEKFVSQWWHHDNLRFSPLILNAEQQQRLDEVNAAEPGQEWLFELQLYVEWGAVRPNTQCPMLEGKEGGMENTQAQLHLYGSAHKVKLAAIRYNKEVEGLVINGIEVLTDRQTQALIHGAYNSLQNGFVEWANWKGKNGWMTLTMEHMHPIAERVMVHVQCCFSAEMQTQQDIDAFEDPELLKNFDVETAFLAHYQNFTDQHYNTA